MSNIAIGYNAGCVLTTGNNGYNVIGAKGYDKFERYVILSLTYKNKDVDLYHYFDQHSKKIDYYLLKNEFFDWGGDFKIAIDHYKKMIPKWLLLYQLKDQNDAWNDIFRYHLIPYYFII